MSKEAPVAEGRIHEFTTQSGADTIEVGRKLAALLKPPQLLVLRGDLSGVRSFRGLVGATREVCLEAYANQDLPFERLVQDLRPERSLLHAPLFQVLLVVQKALLAPQALSGLGAEQLRVDLGLRPDALIQDEPDATDSRREVTAA